jgi:type II secretory pathway pseudopilin PulG
MLMTPSKPQRGMIYLALLLAVALIGGVSAVGLKVAQTIQTRQAEAELLAIGLEFRYALQSYAEATPNGVPPAPESLAELLRDPRYPGVRRHLRRIYHDPLTGKADWGIIRGPDRRIAGIHSLSKGAAIKRDGFPGELAALVGKDSHDQWVFSISDVPAVGAGKGERK